MDKEIKITGKILHLDGDKKYSEKAQNFYNKAKLRAVVRNISEEMQAKFVVELLMKHRPDILVVTGHDSMLKQGRNYYDIYNYKNSRHFVKTVQEARKWERGSDNLVIFAGACQSYYEALIKSGADFASSPGRILIDDLDPLIVANKVATTERNKFITARDIQKELKEGGKAIGGIGARGKWNKIVTTM